MKEFDPKREFLFDYITVVAKRYRACRSGNCNVCCDLSYYG